MKKSLRAIVATALVLAFAAVATFALTANADAAPEFTQDNLALTGTATAGSSYENQENRQPGLAIDGVLENDKYWQAGTGDATNFEIEWAAAQTFDTLVIRWKDGSKTNLDAVSVGGAAVEKTVTSYDGSVDVITFTAATSTKVGFTISGTFSGGCGSFPGEILAVEVYNTAHGDTVGGGEGGEGEGGEGEGGEGGADTGVASTVAFAVVAMSAAAVAFVSKKNAD